MMYQQHWSLGSRPCAATSDGAASCAVQVPFYNKVVNIVFGGLWFGILNVTIVLLVTQVTIHQYADPVAFIAFMTKVRTFATNRDLHLSRLRRGDA
jgi:hypothetical protein